MSKETILTRDRDIRLPEFVILKASAGTGKTRALTLRFTQFLLSRVIKHNDPQQILAITFTRNATKEMKERIIWWLKKCCFFSSHSQADRDLEAILSLVTIDRDQLQAQAEETLNKILGNYSDFQVTTIDSFMANIFKASAIELGISPEAEITIDSGPVLAYAFSRLLQNVRADSPEFGLFQAVCQNLKEMRGSKEAYAWDPASDLENILTDLNRKLAAANRRALQFDLETLRKALSELEERFQASREKVASLLSAWEARPKRSALYSRLSRPRITDWLDYDFKILSQDNLPPALSRELRKLKEVVDRYKEIQARIYFQPHLKIYDRFLEVLEQTRKERNLVFLEDIHCRLANYLDQGVVPDIYFSLGSEIYHYLIDEFQDTSPLQWANLYPLIENALSQGGSLFLVGDTKQAIYGFREADYQIMVNLIKGRDGFASVRPRVAELQENWRSREQLLRWLNRLFPDGIKELPLETMAWKDARLWREAASRSGLDDFTCRPARGSEPFPGYAELKLVDLSRKPKRETANHNNDPDQPEGEELEEPEKKEVQNLIQELLARGYRYADLAILTYENERVKKAAAWLNELQIPFVPYSALDIRSRPIIREILSFLQFLDYPLDELSFSVFLCGQLFQQRLREDGISLQPEAVREFILNHRRTGRAPLYSAFRQNYPILWEAYFEDFFKTVGYLPLYDLVSQVFRVFQPLELFPLEQGALIKLLEVIKNFEGQGKSNLRDFIKFSAETGDDKNLWTIDVPETIDAVKIMTIHKAKGLGFPVVILLLYREQIKSETFYIKESPKIAGTRTRGPQLVEVLRLNARTASARPDFERAYEGYRERERVNKLNTLYVALTRAREELYVIGVKRRNEYPFPLLEAILNLEPEGKDASARCKPDTSLVIKREESRQESGVPLTILQAGKFSPVADRPAFNYYERRRGELIHALLAAVEFVAKDLDQVLAAATAGVRAKALAADEMETAIRTVREFLSLPQVARYFERRPGRVVHREIELVDTRGRLFRADRVVVDPDRVTVIDFKTGFSGNQEQQATYIQQLKSYMSMLSDIYPGRKIEGMLMYPDQKKLEEV
ncbi:MAG: UvrD-helicase domain-containing protein [Candidatus Saccharicenans sp.]|nr:UvrD-helicase domain-containing protein [Candidatus Saccharicenans sp.]